VNKGIHAVRVASGRKIQLRDQPVGAGETCRRILGTLPAWFGIPTSVEDYIAVADRSPTVIASLGDDDVGLLTVVRQSPYAAEVSVMAVLPEHHRHGIGRALLGYAERMLAADGWSSSK
jgi:GNAT superfamily N-acetyltransferase